MAFNLFWVNKSAASARGASEHAASNNIIDAVVAHGICRAINAERDVEHAAERFRK